MVLHLTWSLKSSSSQLDLMPFDSFKPRRRITFGLFNDSTTKEKVRLNDRGLDDAAVAVPVVKRPEEDISR